MGFLIDTCIWVDVERGKVAPSDIEIYTKKEPVFISPVTISELTLGVEMSKSEKIKSKRNAALERLRKKPLLLIDDVTADIFGKIASSLFKSGKQHKHRVQDIWLAAQAIQYDFKLLSINFKDFEDIPGLNFIPFYYSLK